MEKEVVPFENVYGEEDEETVRKMKTHKKPLQLLKECKK
jgi:hypothetical protein